MEAYGSGDVPAWPESCGFGLAFDASDLQNPQAGHEPKCERYCILVYRWNWNDMTWVFEAYLFYVSTMVPHSIRATRHPFDNLDTAWREDQRPKISEGNVGHGQE